MVKTFALFAMLSGTGCAESNAYYAWIERLPPLEPISHEEEHTLRVLYLEDPRLPKPSERDRKKLYKKIEVLLKAWFDYKVAVVEVGAGDLRERFRAAKPVFDSKRSRDYLSVNAIDLGGFGAKDTILQTIRRDLAERDEAVIRRYIRLKPGATKEDAVDAVYRIFEDRLTRLRAIPVGEKGGETFYARDWADTQSFAHWELFLNQLTEADFVLTNTVIAGPDAAMPLYVSIRGGITNGFVTNTENNPYRAVGVVGMFPFLSDAPFFIKERGKLRGKLDAFATFWMHELGHFFLRMKEHYGEAGCVHVAPEGPDIGTWHEDVRRAGNRCRNLPEERLTIF